MKGGLARRAGWVLLAAVVAAGCGDSTPAEGSDDTVAVDAAPADTGGADVAEDALAADTASVGTTDTSGPVCPEPTGARPAARAEHAGVYDPADGRIVLFGGSFGVPVNCSANVAHTYEDDTWVYDLGCDQWHQVEDPNTPVGRVRHAAVLDTLRHRMLIVGGRERAGSSGTYTRHGEVSAFDLATETWSELATNAGPAPRYNLAAVYDPTGDRMIIMGGNTSTSAATYKDSNDVWALDLATDTWSEVTTAGSKPARRFWHAGLWDDTRQRLVIFGGSNAQQVFSPSATYFSDAWVLDFTQSPPAWSRLDQGTRGPEGRFWSGMAHDVAGDRYLVFAGHDDKRLGNRNDLWALDPSSGAWTLLGAGDTYNKDPIATCDFPPDFTNVDAAFPERRHAGVVVSDGQHAWVTGGKTDCGNIDDVFELDLATAAWTERVTATVGEVCLRKGGLNCNDLCF